MVRKLRRIMEGVWSVDKDHDLIWSPDDGAFYLQRFPDQVTSQLFETAEDAIYAFDNQRIDWS